jgi:hypothetical protein
VKTELVRMLKHHLCSRVAPAIRNQLQKLVFPLAACPTGMLLGFTQCVCFAGCMLCRRAIAVECSNVVNRFVKDTWPGLVKEKMLLVVRRQSELDWRRSQERDRLFCVAR